ASRNAKKTIHSGHFMVSRVHEPNGDDDEEEVASPFSDDNKGFDFLNAVKKTTTTYNFGNPIDESLTKLFECMTLAYRYTITSPRWKQFRGLHVSQKQRIRLNNLIWREWHMQYIYSKRPMVCQFAMPLSDDIHSRPEAVVLEGKYWKRRLDVVTAEYKKWRRYYKDQAERLRYLQGFGGAWLQDTSCLSELELLERVKEVTFIPCLGSGMKGDGGAGLQGQSNSDLNIMDMDFSSDFITALNHGQFSFPNPRELSELGRSDLIQPGLYQLQPNLDDPMDIDFMHLGLPQTMLRDKGDAIGVGVDASASSPHLPASIPSHGVDATLEPQLPPPSSSLSSHPSTSSLSAPGVCKTAIQTLLGTYPGAMFNGKKDAPLQKQQQAGQTSGLSTGSQASPIQTTTNLYQQIRPSASSSPSTTATVGQLRAQSVSNKMITVPLSGQLQASSLPMFAGTSIGGLSLSSVSMRFFICIYNVFTISSLGDPTSPASSDLDLMPDSRRAAHLSAEQKRRWNLKTGFDMLQQLVPSLSQNPRVSKATMLQKTAEYCKKLKAERVQMQKEAAILKREIESLNSAIGAVQAQLPETGVPMTRQRKDQMREMFDDYVCQRTKENWKFWIFSVIMNPLYDSYCCAVSTTSMDELCKTSLGWLDQSCSLVTLRPNVLNSLKKLCTTTSILTEPMRVREQALQAVDKAIKAEPVKDR
ncbi:hypothetical protein EGW08_014920, partial [Elysia chlorotica]